MSPPKVPLTGGTIELPPARMTQPQQNKAESERTTSKSSGDAVSRAELETALRSQRAEDKANSLESWLKDVDVTQKDHGVRIVKLESNQDTAKTAKEQRHGLRIALIGGACAIVAGSGIASVKACTAFRDEMRGTAASVASDEVQRRQETASQQRLNVINAVGPQLIKDALDEQDRRNADKGLVLVPKDSLKAKPKSKP